MARNEDGRFGCALWNLASGEIWFDGVLVRKDGLFVLPGLEGLNPKNLS